MEIAIDTIEGLNDKQTEAVRYFDGSLLVLAGAGTGKTKVLTYKIAEIINSGLARPTEILAVTFTNKAAREMKERAEALIDAGSSVTHGVWLGTFHSIATKILRVNHHLAGLDRDFVIIDADDQLRLVRNIIKDMELDDKKYSPKYVISIIQRLKDDGLSIQALLANNVTNVDKTILRIYETYQANLTRLNAVDFGDLLLYNVMIFSQNEHVLQGLQNRFKYILVDEYQDTNLLQYLWLKFLCGSNVNICCVGDEDQSIYGWRGAKIENILKFEHDFPGAKIIRLEQNYRSSPAILKAASSLIAKNSERLGKNLWTNSDQHEKIKLFSAANDKNEAETIVKQIVKFKSAGYKLSQIGILFRSSSGTRLFEESLLAAGVPYQVIGGLRFYSRQEIKDAIAYLRVARSPNDFLAFERVVNVPKRGVGQATVIKISDYLKATNNTTIAEAIKYLIVSGDIKGKARDNLRVFAAQLEKWHKQKDLSSVSDLAKTILNESGYLQFWQEEKTIEAKSRIENLKELISALADFPSLDEFLEHVSLVSDVDNQAGQDIVSLMTIHAAKGLEFDIVFLPCWEEGTFPSSRSLGDDSPGNNLEEERRLAYVAITRAKKILFISYAHSRKIFGQYGSCVLSRFIQEIDQSVLEKFYSTASSTGNLNSFHRPSFNNSTFNSPKRNTNMPTEVSDSRFKVGQAVFHQKFGSGKVVSILNNHIEVYFSKAGYKVIIADYLN
jgi:DNA helicase-2/ATP-dependent DNA helicase PcrA